MRPFRWAVFLSILVLVPPTLAGSICFREDRAGTFELDCACTQLPAAGGTRLTSAPSTPDCGPCRDIRITALNGHLPTGAGAQLDAAGTQRSPDCPEPKPSSAAPRKTSRSGVPPGRPPAGLRC